MVEPEPPLRVGLKEGIDIGTLVDLDSMLNFDDDQDDVKDFLTLVLLRHLGLSMPSFGRFSPEGYIRYCRTSSLSVRKYIWKQFGLPKVTRGIFLNFCRSALRMSESREIDAFQDETLLRQLTS